MSSLLHLCSIHFTHTCLCPADIPPVYVAAMQTAIAEAHASILDLLHEEGFAYIVNDLLRMAVFSILALLLQGMSEVNQHLYFNNVTVTNLPLQYSAPFPTISVPPSPSDILELIAYSGYFQTDMFVFVFIPDPFYSQSSTVSTFFNF